MLRDAFLFPIYVAVGFAVPFLLYIVVRRKAQSISIISMRDLIESDARAPILFLRPFDDDQVALPKPKAFSIFRAIRIGDAPTHLEHQVLEELTELGPVVAIGDGSTGIVPYGAARHYMPGDEWKSRVCKLIDTSRAIVIVLNDTPGLWWEVNAVLARGCVDRTLFVFPFSDSDKRERLWTGFCEALAANGISSPKRFRTSKTLLGIFRDNSAWRVACTDDISATDTLALLRIFGTRYASEPPVKWAAPWRYPFSIGLMVLLLVVFNIDNMLRSYVFTPVVMSQAPEGWQVQTILASGHGPDLGHNLYFETSAADTVEGHSIGFVRRAQASPDLLWLSPDGLITQTVTLAVPERDRAGLARLPIVTPIAMRAHESGRVKAAISISDGQSAKLELREFSQDGKQLSKRVIRQIPSLSRYLAGVFADDDSFYVSGQVELADGSLGPFVGKLNPDRNWAWYYSDFGAGGWGNDIAVASNLHVAAALELDRQFFVVGMDPQGWISFKASSPFAEQFGTVSSIIPADENGWLVAGDIQATRDLEAPQTPIVAELGQDGTYKWETALPGLENYYVQGIAKANEYIYLAVRGGYLNETRSAVVVLSNDGEVIETLEFFASGQRSIRTISTAKDGALWIYGLASDIPENLPPIEHMFYRAMPWVIRVNRTSAEAKP